MLSLASNAYTVEAGFTANIFALLPIPVPASRICFLGFRKLLNSLKEFQSNLSINHFL